MNDKKSEEKLQETKPEDNFDIEITNFGPINKGNLSIKPLTIFVGPNQSGKSYAAMLIYAIYKTHKAISTSFQLIDSFYSVTDMKMANEIQELLSYVDLKTADNEKTASYEFSNEVVNKVFRITYQKAYEEKLQSEIARTFATSIRDLKRINSRKNFSVKIFDYLTEKRNKFVIVEADEDAVKVQYLPEGSLSLKLDINLGEEDITKQIFDQYRRKLKITPFSNYENFHEKFEKLPLYFFILQSIHKTFSRRYGDCYYLPAARSGILQGHKALSASFVSLAPYGGSKTIEIPAISGILSDFINSLIFLPTEKGELYDIARSLEKELIYGKIILKKQEKSSYPEVLYVFNDVEIPIHRSSSTVSELAPIFLYLKYLINPSDVLIIEEPEAHLHPYNQRILAKLIVKLIRHNVRIILTTHSDYFLEQINHYIITAKLNDEIKSKRYNFEKGDYLDSKEVSAHVFKYEKGKGNTIKNLDVNDIEGIPLGEFSEVTEALYQESVKIQRDLDNIK